MAAKNSFGSGLWSHNVDVAAWPASLPWLGLAGCFTGIHNNSRSTQRHFTTRVSTLRPSSRRMIEERTMKRNVMLSFAAGALALGLSFTALQAAMPIPDAAPGVHAGAGLTPVGHNYRVCVVQYSRCLSSCAAQHKGSALQNCRQRCRRAFNRCYYHR